jgi:hypothetical protein
VLEPTPEPVLEPEPETESVAPASEPTSEQRVCAYCESTFVPSQPDQRFCSKDCERGSREDRRGYVPAGSDESYVAAMQAAGGRFR